MPDLPVPDHVQHAEPRRVLHQIRGQVVAVRAVAAGGVDILEAAGGRGEVTGPALRVLTGRTLTEATRVPLEARRPGLLVRVQRPRRDAPAAARGGVADRAGLLRPGAVGVP